MLIFFQLSRVFLLTDHRSKKTFPRYAVIAITAFRCLKDNPIFEKVKGASDEKVEKKP